MRNLNIYQGLFFLLVPVLALFAITCNGNGPGETCPSGNPTRTDGNNEFKRWLAQVFKNSGEVTDDCWHPLDSDDTLSTDSSGEAELNFSDCYPGRLYCFKNSSGTIRVKGCRKAEYPTEATCVLDGSWYTGACAGEYQLHTGSGLIKKVSSTFSTTYLPENRSDSGRDL